MCLYKTVCCGKEIWCYWYISGWCFMLSPPWCSCWLISSSACFIRICLNEREREYYKVKTVNYIFVVEMKWEKNWERHIHTLIRLWTWWWLKRDSTTTTDWKSSPKHKSNRHADWPDTLIALIILRSPVLHV